MNDKPRKKWWEYRRNITRKLEFNEAGLYETPIETVGLMLIEIASQHPDKNLTLDMDYDSHSTACVNIVYEESETDAEMETRIRQYKAKNKQG